MPSTPCVRLDRLADLCRVPRRTAREWWSQGIIRGRNLGRGRGRGIVLTAEEASIAVQLMRLRGARGRLRFLRDFRVPLGGRTYCADLVVVAPGGETIVIEAKTGTGQGDPAVAKVIAHAAGRERRA